MIGTRRSLVPYWAAVEGFLTGPRGGAVPPLPDGKTLKPMASSMARHKRALDGDQGRTRAAWGTIAPNPCYTAEVAEECKAGVSSPP